MSLRYLRTIALMPEGRAAAWEPDSASVDFTSGVQTASHASPRTSRESCSVPETQLHPAMAPASTLLLLALGWTVIRTDAIADCMSCFRGKLRSDNFEDIFGGDRFSELCGSYDPQCLEKNCKNSPQLHAISAICSNSAGLEALGMCYEQATGQVCAQGVDFAPGNCEAMARAADCLLEGSFGCGGDALAMLKESLATFNSALGCRPARSV